ncbi:MAG: ABC transporter ATP-binding protein [Lachnospiraceae bacterium]|jgi:ABC-2 type transport system ATP-binding protein|nr:ABC transporter ATP-binding protein [Lachnospiraceae bacterium]
MNNAIVIKDVTKHYKDFTLDHVSFQVPEGSIVGFVGENGAGKSTTIRAILDLIHLEQGEIEVLGLSRKDREDPRWKEQIGAVFDTGHIPDIMTAKQVARMMEKLYTQWDREAYAGYLKRFRLSEDKKYKDFSRGMRMKLSLAVALSHGARLLLLDECTSGLDPMIRDEILDLFLEFIQKEDHSILISSHIISDLEKAADYIVFIHEGRICFEEEKDYLRENYGVVHGTREKIRRLPGRMVVGWRDNQFGCDALVKDRREVKRLYPDLSVDAASIEEIMLYTVKGGRS